MKPKWHSHKTKEALRVCAALPKRMTQEQAGKIMGISRAQVYWLECSAIQKVIDALNDLEHIRNMKETAVIIHSAKQMGLIKRGGSLTIKKKESVHYFLKRAHAA